MIKGKWRKIKNLERAIRDNRLHAFVTGRGMARILINFTTPYANKLTGISTYVWRITEALHRHGRHEYVLATNWTADHLPQSIKQLNMPIVHRTLPVNEFSALVANTRQLPAIKRELNAALIFHTQPLAMLGKMQDSVVVLHDLYRVTHPSLFHWGQRVQWRCGTRVGFTKAGRLIAVSEATRQKAIAAYPAIADRMSVVHEASPIEGGAVTSMVFDRVEWDFGLMVANITRNKNIELLFQALGLLAEEGVFPRIMIVGRDDSRLLPQLFRRFPHVKVEALGGVSESRLTDLYSRASVYINTSTVEGFCLPILEAQTLGVPVICADIDVLREVAGDGAAFVKPSNPSSLAEILRRFMTEPEYGAELRSRGRINCTRFSWEKAAKETENIFDGLLAQLGAGSR